MKFSKANFSWFKHFSVYQAICCLWWLIVLLYRILEAREMLNFFYHFQRITFWTFETPLLALLLFNLPLLFRFLKCSCYSCFSLWNIKIFLWFTYLIFLCYFSLNYLSSTYLYHLYITFFYLCVCTCVRVCVYTCAMAHKWRTESNLQELVSPYVFCIWKSGLQPW